MLLAQFWQLGKRRRPHAADGTSREPLRPCCSGRPSPLRYSANSSGTGASVSARQVAELKRRLLLRSADLDHVEEDSVREQLLHLRGEFARRLFGVDDDLDRAFPTPSHSVRKLRRACPRSVAAADGSRRRARRSRPAERDRPRQGRRLSVVLLAEVERDRRAGVAAGDGRLRQRLVAMDVSEGGVGDRRQRRGVSGVAVRDRVRPLGVRDLRAGHMEMRGEKQHVSVGLASPRPGRRRGRR